MKSSYRKKPARKREIAEERILVLFREAKEMFPKDRVLADRYVALARKISMKFKVRIPSRLQKQFCKHCYCYLVPSVNCRVRLRQGKVVYYCLSCKKYMRFPYLRERKEIRKLSSNSSYTAA